MRLRWATLPWPLAAQARSRVELPRVCRANWRLYAGESLSSHAPPRVLRVDKNHRPAHDSRVGWLRRSKSRSGWVHGRSRGGCGTRFVATVIRFSCHCPAPFETGYCSKVHSHGPINPPVNRFELESTTRCGSLRLAAAENRALMVAQRLRCTAVQRARMAG